jgi:hypothetical protein
MRALWAALSASKQVAPAVIIKVVTLELPVKNPVVGICYLPT